MVGVLPEYIKRFHYFFANDYINPLNEVLATSHQEFMFQYGAVKKR
jgi:hypothetical protein